RSCISGWALMTSGTSGSSLANSSNSCRRSGSGSSRKSSRISARVAGRLGALIPAILPRSDAAGLGPGHDRNAHGAAPFRPRAVIVASVPETEEMLQHEPGVRCPFADATVRDDGFVFAEPDLVTVNRVELRACFEGAV